MLVVGALVTLLAAHFGQCFYHGESALCPVATPGEAFTARSSMKAMMNFEYGDPDKVLKLVDRPIPSFRSTEVLVELHAASLNPADYKMMQGNFFLIDPFLSRPPQAVGMDFAGRIVAVGSNCRSGVEVGDMVHGMTPFYQTGSLAEYIPVQETALAVVPAGMNATQAAALPLVRLYATSLLPLCYLYVTSREPVQQSLTVLCL